MTASGVDLEELRRHAAVGRPRRAGARDRPRGLPHLYAARQRRPLPDLYVTDQAEARGGGRFRWFFSTCLAATVGAVAIVAVVFGSREVRNAPVWPTAPADQIAKAPAKSPAQTAAAAPGLPWKIPKSDRLQTTMDAVSTRYIVQDSIRERRANREYLLKRPYARVLIRLAAVEPDPAISVPPFNPLKLFAHPVTQQDSTAPGSLSSGPDGGDVTIRVVELLGSILPAEDGQALEAGEVGDLVARALANEPDRADIRPSFAPEGVDFLRRNANGATTAFTTVLHKTTSEHDEVSQETDTQRVRVKLARGETLSRLLVRMGADTWQSRDMVEAARSILPESAVPPGSDVELSLEPSLSGSGKPEPVRYTVLGPNGEHRITVERNAAGEFYASAVPLRPTEGSGAATPSHQSSSLYSSLYHGALAQGVPPETVQSIIRIHAYEADFRRRARGSDAVELFFDLKDEDKGADGSLGELLLTSMTIGGTTQRFYRFKSPDGSLDYYDISGNNSRRFLLRKPVRSEEVRLTSGFGIRFHPLLNQRKLHAGIDWAGPVGSPIIAAGNGTIEEAGYKGQYGNYVRIRHANSYQTAYGHMRGIAPGIAPGVKVRQGEVIGYLGSTGLSSGPHLHFEVLVGNRWIDPLSVQAAREKRLTGRQLAAFQRERVRIDELMRAPPVRVSSIDPRR